ncbi:MAG: T9SS type A sorting domain-containing protein [Bacteroidetes bacterium]|nr:T9SS type A sorting domain-containing protein [Bacteroidota bacterium]
MGLRWILAAACLLSSANHLNAQCWELLISEYVCGTGNNKAIEIYNPRRDSVYLGNYRLTRWENGNAIWSAPYSDTLSGWIGPNEVKVYVPDRRDTAATGEDTAVAKSLLLKADGFLSKNKNQNSALWFDGDDAICLERNFGGVFLAVDILGKIGQRPFISGSSEIAGWSDSFPFYTGKGTQYTRLHSLIRKPYITRGINQNPVYFNPSVEYTHWPVNTFDSLGTHHCDCNKFAAGLKALPAEPLQLYPVPAAESVWLNTPGNKALGGILQVVDSHGKTVLQCTISGFPYRLNVQHLSPGLYQIVWIRGNQKMLQSRLMKY